MDYKKIINKGNTALANVIKANQISKENAIDLTELVDAFQEIVKESESKNAMKKPKSKHKQKF